MTVIELSEMLDSRNIKYDILPHRRAYTAQATAASACISGKEVAKVVMVKSEWPTAVSRRW